MKRSSLIFCVAALTLAMAFSVACMRSDDKSSSSSSSSSVPSSQSPSSSSIVTIPPSVSEPDEPILDDLPEGDSSRPEDSSSSGSASDSSAAATMSADFSTIGTLDAASQDWGPGVNRDAANRSLASLDYNQRFGEYDALFIAADEPKVYLTFDEGYEYGLTAGFLDILKEKDVKAAFFVTAHFVQSEPELIQRMIDEGHTVGNHSWAHENYSTLSPQEAAEDMQKLHSYVKENFGYEMEYFRFPSGNFNVQSLAVAQQLGYRTLFWSFAYKDWLTDDQPDPAEARERISGAAANGTIYLLHAVSQTNHDVLADVIDDVRARGFEWGDPGRL